MIWRMNLPAQRLGQGPLTQRNKRRTSPPGMKPRGESGAGPWSLLCPVFKLVLNPKSQAILTNFQQASTQAVTCPVLLGSVESRKPVTQLTKSSFLVH